MNETIDVAEGHDFELIFSDLENQLVARQHKYWKGINGTELKKLAQKQIKRCKTELSDKGLFTQDEDIVDLVWDCIARCWKKFDPAKTVKFSTYLHSAVDNAVKDKKDQIAQKKKKQSMLFDKNEFTHDFQIRLPEPQAKFVGYLNQYTGISKAEILRSIMCWGIHYFILHGNKLAAEVGERYSPKFYSRVLKGLTQRYRMPKGERRAFHFDGMFDVMEMLEEQGVKPSQFMATTIDLYSQGIQYTVDTEGLEAARDIALSLPLHRMVMDIHLSERLSRQLPQ